MRLTKLCFSIAAILVQTSLLIPAPAAADTYKVFTLDSDEARFVYGMNPSGDVVISVDADSNGQCVTVVNCYETFIGGVLASRANAPPPGFLIDDGTPCGPIAAPGLTVLHAVCNNGREVFSARAPGQVFPDLYTGPNLVDLFPGQGEGPFLFLNSEGDILWNDPRSEFWYEAFDLTSQVPEPGSLFFLATGTLALAETMRRRALLWQS
ncbi:MAG TPA: hypothetical protein VK684_04375 [Edaphobacter sp.]|nr:hypothetical protein [Edaphobacter sp.]